MKYNLPGFPIEDFKRADALVRATLLAGGRVDIWNTPRRVTSSIEDLPKFYRDKVTRCLNEGEMLRGASNPSPNNRHEFDLWFNPDIVGTTDRFQATVLHELCHGYVGVEKGHESPWRRLYARTLFHHHHAVAPIEHRSSLVDLANWSYTKRAKSETTAQFLARIHLDRAVWFDQAEHEHDRVKQAWTKMTDSEHQSR